jgi:hypothetical protein
MPYSNNCEKQVLGVAETAPPNVCWCLKGLAAESTLMIHRANLEKILCADSELSCAQLQWTAGAKSMEDQALRPPEKLPSIQM